MNKDVNLHAILLFGNICSGKTSLGKHLEPALNYQYLSFGEIKRKTLQNQNEIGLKIEREIQNGNPPPEKDCVQIILDSMRNNKIILSGFPITEREYVVFIEYFEIDAVISISCLEDTIRSRYKNRVDCPICNYPGEKGDFCPIHQKEMTEKKNQDKNNMEARLSLFNNRIVPFFKKHNWTQPTLVIQSTETTTKETIEWLKTINIL